MFPFPGDPVSGTESLCKNIEGETRGIIKKKEKYIENKMEDAMEKRLISFAHKVVEHRAKAVQVMKEYKKRREHAIMQLKNNTKNAQNEIAVQQEAHQKKLKAIKQMQEAERPYILASGGNPDGMKLLLLLLY